MTTEEVYLKKAELIALKKLGLKKSDAISVYSYAKDFEVVKAKKTNILGVDVDTATIEAIANTYYWLDSHGDVHGKGCFTKSIKENIKNIYHLDNHNHLFSGVIGKVVGIKEVVKSWQELGVNKAGNTICVLGTSEISEDYNAQAVDLYANKLVYNHSVGMVYVNIELAIKEKKSEYEAENKVWDEVYPLLGNPEEADSQGWFWHVKEAKLKEFSGLLWEGSNTLTPTQSVKIEQEAEIITSSEIEPSQDTQVDVAKLAALNIFKTKI